MEITEDVLTISRTPPRLTRQNGCSDLLSLNNNKSSNLELSLDTEVNFDEYIFRSMPNFGNLSNLTNFNNNNLPQLKRYSSEFKQTTKSSNLKRINTF